jgi:hypothetical protein
MAIKHKKVMDIFYDDAVNNTVVGTLFITQNKLK